MNGYLVLLGAVACSDAQPAWSRYETVEGPEGSASRLIGDLRDVPPLPYRESWSISPDTWSDPRQLALGDGIIAVVDQPATQIHLIKYQTGEELRSIGREGDGPGEWRRLSSAAIVGDRIVVSTGGSHDLAIHDLGGAAVGVIPLGQSGVLLQVTDASTVGTLPRGGSNPLRWIDVESGIETRTVELTGSRAYTADHYGDCWRVALTREAVVRMTCSAGRIEVLAADGQVIQRMEWSDQPQASTEAELDAFTARFWSLQSGGRPLSPIVQRQLAYLREANRIRPVYADLSVDFGTGRMLIVQQPFGDHGSTPATLHILTADARHVGRLETDRHVVDAGLRGDTVALLTRDRDTDQVVLELWEIDLGM